MQQSNFPFTAIDLTHDLSPKTPSWTGNCGFNHEIKMDYDLDSDEVSFRVQQIKMHAGIGTHMDAPSHCIPGGKNIEAIALTDLIAPCVVINTNDNLSAGYRVSVHDITEFESQHGIIQAHTFVIIHTHWAQFYRNPEKYRNNLQFPSISKEAALLLLKRDIVGLGIDTLSPDCPGSGYPVHKAILGAGKYIVENVSNAANMPAIGAFSLALPMKTVGGTEAPMRLIALVPS